MRYIKLKDFFVDLYKKVFVFFTDTIFRKMMYNTLFKLPLLNYIDIVVDGKYNKLLKVPIIAPKSVLMSMYSSLIEEYILLSENNDLSAEKARQEDEEYLSKKIYLYSVGLATLVEFKEATGIVDYFISEGYSGTNEEIAKQVDSDLKVMNIELLGIKKLRVETPNVKTTRKDFEKTIIMANKNGYTIDRNGSTAAFIQALNLQREEIINLETKFKK